jgi:flagellar basal body L-ring protein FlgH
MLATAANAEAPRSRAVKEGDVLTVMLEYQTGTTSTAYRVAVRVIEVQANKVLLIEGHRSWMDSGSVWEYTLSGRVDPKSVSPDGSVLSENITDLSIAKRQRGSSTDSTKYPWIVRLYDWIGPS